MHSTFSSFGKADQKSIANRKLLQDTPELSLPILKFVNNYQYIYIVHTYNTILQTFSGQVM